MTIDENPEAFARPIMKIPFNNLTPNSDLFWELAVALERVIESGWFIDATEVEAFEQEWADYTGSKYCIGVSSGQAALELLLKAHGIGYGDDVIVPSWTAVPTWKAVLNVGAMVRPVDVDYDTMLLQPETVAGLQAKAAIPVHLYGYQANVEYHHYELDIINDACQAHGLKGLDNAAWSFYPTKNLGAYGDGGAITTDYEAVAMLCRKFRDSNRLDELQAAMLRVKLGYLDNSERAKNASIYDELLPNQISPYVPSESVYHQYVIRTPNRDGLQSHLLSKGIETLIHYPVPPHRLLGLDYDLPVADRLANEVLSLPITCNQEQVEYVCEVINEWADNQ